MTWSPTAYPERSSGTTFERNERHVSHDTLIRALSRDGFVDIIVADSTAMVEEARRIHSTLPTATAALGRLLTAASMMGSDLKSDDASVTLRVKGSGEIGTILCTSDRSASARGTVSNPLCDPPRKPNGKLDVGAAVGSDGYLEVIRDLGFGEPYAGRVPLVSGEIAEDLTSYFFRSEQTPTVLGLGVLTESERVLAAGGYLIRLLPGAPDAVIDELERCAPLFVPVTELLSGGAGPEEIVRLLLPGFDMEILPDSSRRVTYRCRCSRERATRALISLGKDELMRFAEECREAPAEIKCEFCTKKYVFTSSDLLALSRTARSGEASPGKS